jgi:hypothetical protein
MPAPKHSRKWTKPFLSPVLVAGLVALALFVVGPQAGSLDDDGDGNPDVPVVVMASSSVAQVSHATQLNERSLNASDVVAATPIGIHSDRVKRGYSDARRYGRSALPSLCPLRC